MRFQGGLRGDSLKGTFTEEPGESRGLCIRALAQLAPTLRERNLIWNKRRRHARRLTPLAVRSATVPAVVFLHGSGPEGRWASRFLAMPARQPRHRRADLRQARVGQSTGNWRQATPNDLARDAATAVARLRQEPGIDPRRIGLHGTARAAHSRHSFAAQAPDIAFIIASAAAGLPMDSVEIFSILNSQLPDASSAADSANARTYVAELVAVAYQGQPRARLDSLAAAWHDRPWFFAPPAPTIRIGRSRNSTRSISRSTGGPRCAFRPPHLRRGGPARPGRTESAARIASTLARSSPDVNVTVRILPGADHTFRLPPGRAAGPLQRPTTYRPCCAGCHASALTFPVVNARTLR